MTEQQGLVASAEIYDPQTGKFTLAGSMTAGRDYHTATLLADGRVFIFGGNSGVASAEIYDPTTGKFSRTGSARSGRWQHTATLLADGRVLVAGGGGANDSVYSTAEIYDPRTGKFTATGSMSIVRSEHTATLLPDGRVLIAGGATGVGLTSQATPSTELYDPRTGKFTSGGTMTAGRMDQTATLLPDGRVLIAGGIYLGPAGGTPVRTAELYNP
jgi:hypothetical protein